MIVKPKIKLDSIIKAKFPEINRECDDVINCGGCGIFADELYKLLTDLGYKPKILVEIYYSEDKEFAKDNLRKGNGPDSIGWRHILIEVKNKVIDSNWIGNKSKGDYRSVVEGMSYDTLQNGLNLQDGIVHLTEKLMYLLLISIFNN